MGEEFLEIAVYVLILAVVAIVTFVKKAIEKASSGKDIDLGQVVQERLQRYMKGGRPSREIFGRDAEAEPPAAVRPAAARPPAASPPPTPDSATARLVPASKPIVHMHQESLPPLAGQKRKPFWDKNAKVASVDYGRKRRIDFERGKVGRAVLLAEILGPPMAERQDYRLF